jgi:hypothetical protein
MLVNEGKIECKTCINHLGLPPIFRNFKSRAVELVDQADALLPLSDAASRALLDATRRAAEAAALRGANGGGVALDARRASWQQGRWGVGSSSFGGGAGSGSQNWR